MPRVGQTVTANGSLVVFKCIREVTQDCSRAAWPEHCHQHSNNQKPLRPFPRDYFRLLRFNTFKQVPWTKYMFP